MDKSQIKKIKKEASSRQKPHTFLRALFAKLKNPFREIIMYAPKDFFNPYQTLIYSEFKSYVTPISVDRIMRYKKMGISNVLHIHWDEHMFRGEADYVDQVKYIIKRFKQEGGKVIWTVHNQMPHEITDLEKQKFLNDRKFIITHSDLIHVHSNYASNYLQSDFQVSSKKIALISHPSYLGWYNEPERKSTYEDKAKTFLLFGNVRGYKGIGLIFDAFSRIDFPDKVQCIHFAGRGAKKINQNKLNKINLKLTDNYIDDEAVPEIFAEADYAIFGFSSILTSGSLMLALTFGKPPICPAHPSIVESLPEGLHDFLYLPNDPVDFARVIDYATSLESKKYEQKVDICLEYSRKHSPAHISKLLEKEIFRQ